MSMNTPELNIDIQSMENDEQNSKHSTTPMEFYKEIENIIDESDNIESMPRESAMSTDSVKSLKRTNDFCDESIAPVKKRCSFKEFGIFRRENFTDEIIWNRFVTACKELRKEKLLLQRKNERLLKKIKTFNDIIEELKNKNLIIDSVTEIMNVS
ncbi:hypothetical protein ACS0PU_005347 [Formica fusca]